jgi:methylglyoxal/glyoxal reductase
MKQPLTESVELNNGVKIPLFGLGLYQVKSGRKAISAVQCALAAGYRHFDTAAAYGNEADLGEALAASDVPREQLFITTKLWNEDHGYNSTLRAFDESRSKLRTDYIDLYLIHWPVRDLRTESWRAMMHLYERGTCRAIGVSNYTIRHLRELLDWSDIIPAVNQVEFSPFLYQKDLLDFCAEKRIQLETYSPLTKGKKLGHPVLIELAKKYGKTPAQILIRWAIDHKLVVIPKSARCERIEENAQVFDFAIRPEDLRILDELDENFRTSWDPTDAP